MVLQAALRKRDRVASWYRLSDGGRYVRAYYVHGEDLIDAHVQVMRAEAGRGADVQRGDREGVFGS